MSCEELRPVRPGHLSEVKAVADEIRYVRQSSFVIAVVIAVLASSIAFAGCERAPREQKQPVADVAAEGDAGEEDGRAVAWDAAKLAFKGAAKDGHAAAWDAATRAFKAALAHEFSLSEADPVEFAAPRRSAVSDAVWAAKVKYNAALDATMQAARAAVEADGDDAAKAKSKAAAEGYNVALRALRAAETEFDAVWAAQTAARAAEAELNFPALPKGHPAWSTPAGAARVKYNAALDAAMQAARAAGAAYDDWSKAGPLLGLDEAEEAKEAKRKATAWAKYEAAATAYDAALRALRAAKAKFYAAAPEGEL